MYWTPGWGNLATVGSTLIVFLATTSVASSRYRFDQEESRREVQRSPAADAVEALFTFIHAARNFTNQSAVLEYVLENNPNPAVVRNEKVAVIDEARALGPLYDSTSRAIRLTQLSVVDTEVLNEIGACALWLSVVMTAAKRHSSGLHLENPADDMGAQLLAQHRAAMEESIAGLNRTASAFLSVAKANLRPQARRSPWWSRTILA